MPDAKPFTLKDQIKLVIWDLDETFWQGTLSEGEIEIDHATADVVRTLNRRGIVNSICSKNDFDTVEARFALEKGLWDEFVFPRIDWVPKGEIVAQIIADMQLRAPNVLFIDDNIGNLKEAEHYSPGLQIAGPEIIPSLLAFPQCAGKDDHALTRLEQYRQLEAKASDKRNAKTSNEDFLRACGIQVHKATDCLNEQDRILELINRTNQLNYTKRRLTEVEFAGLVADTSRDTAYVTVNDRYGDYGLCGFYSVKDGHLTDFVFSCRILHMGVENWLYQQLGCPPVELVGDVSTPLVPDVPITWINEVSGASTDAPASAVQKAGDARILLKGGCDLVALNDFMAGSLSLELNYNNDNGSLVEWHNIEILRQSTPETVERHGAIIDKLPFLSRDEFSTRALDPALHFTHVALSLLNEYGQGLYRHRESGLIIPYGQYYVDITREEHWPELKAKAITGFDETFFAWFRTEFEFIGAVTIERFQDNIRWLANAVPPGRTLVLINGAEVDLSAAPDIGDEDRRVAKLGLHLHQRRMNEALDEVLPTLPNVRLCDVRTFVTAREDVTYNTRHYTRKTHLMMAQALGKVAESNLRVRGPLGLFFFKARRKLNRIVRGRPVATGASAATRDDLRG